MNFDRHDHSWKPAHEPEIRLRSSRPLVLALSLLAVAALGLGVRSHPRAARASATVAAAMLP
jgi:hypothetical protein